MGIHKANNPQNLQPEKRPRGRPKGAKDKIQGDIRARFLSVFEALNKNPKTSLKTWAAKDPKWFFDLSKALLPKQINVDGDIRAAVMLVLSNDDRKLLQTSIKDLAGAMIEQANK